MNIIISYKLKYLDSSILGKNASLNPLDLERKENREIREKHLARM